MFNISGEYIMISLVTGCAGFIGSHLCEKLIKKNEKVIGIDSLSPYYSIKIKENNLKNLKKEKNFHFVKKDILKTDLKKILKKVDFIYHFAAQPGVRESWGNFKIYAKDNILATFKLLEEAKNFKIKKFIYASSSSIYGEAEKMPTKEETKPQPISPYGITKLAGENLVFCYFKNYQLPVISLRFFTVYGERQRPDMAFFRFIKGALEGKEIPVFGDGKQTRNFTYIDDAIFGTLAAAKSKIIGEIFNLGGGSQASVLEVLKMIEKICGKKLKIKFLKKTKGDPLHTSADIQKAKKAFSFKPKVSLFDGLKEQYKWFISTF